MLIHDKEDLRDFIKEIPEDVEKQSIDLTSGLNVQIRNQYSSCACTGFSFAYFMSILSSKLLGEWICFDPWFIYYKARELTGNEEVNTGVSCRNLMKTLYNYGCLTKDATKLDDMNDKPSEEDLRLASYNKIRSYFRIPNENLINGILHTLINEKLPIIIGTKLYKKSWRKASSSGVLKSLDEDEWESNHAMCLYGYDKDEDMFLVLNSHGYDFGNNGRLKISPEYLLKNSFDNWTVGYDYY